MQNKLIQKQPLTQAIFDDELWEVKTHDKTHRLTGKQAQMLKSATTQGLRGLIWFDGFAISIPHITSVTRIKQSKSKLEKQSKDLAKQFGF